MYTNKTSMRTQIPSTQQHIYPNASEITLSMMLDTHLQRITHTGSVNAYFMNLKKPKSAGSRNRTCDLIKSTA